MIDNARPLARDGDRDEPHNGDRHRHAERTAGSPTRRVSTIGRRSRNDILDVEAAARGALGHDLDETAAAETPAQEKHPHRPVSGQPDHDPRRDEVNQERGERHVENKEKKQTLVDAGEQTEE